MYLNFNSAIYNKALEIGSLSKKISDYLNADLALLSESGQENPDIYFSGDIIQHSMSLSTEILKAEQTTQSDEKYHHAHTLKWLTYRLNQNCRRLRAVQQQWSRLHVLIKKRVEKVQKTSKTVDAELVGKKKNELLLST